MTDYNWDDIELKFFGPDYKTLTPKEKLKLIYDIHNLDPWMHKDSEVTLSKINDEVATEIYRHFLAAEAALPEALSALEDLKASDPEIAKNLNELEKLFKDLI
jgi:hypothetical protein